jgi:hypothetical protein
MRFEVPQFIDVEAKIVGPLTWKQFVYIAGGSGILVIMYFKLSFLFFVVFGIPIGALSASLAFHKVNNRPLSLFAESVFNYFVKKKLYLWKRNEIQTIITHSEEYKSPSANLAFTNQKTISSLAHNLEIHNPHQE